MPAAGFSRLLLASFAALTPAIASAQPMTVDEFRRELLHPLFATQYSSQNESILARI